VITDNAGTIQEESDYYPYGGELPVSGSDPNHYKFTGKERDAESGLDNFGARYDSSSLGRFMTPDWAARATAVPYAVFGDPQSLNLYGYVRNDPVSRVDADGHVEPDAKHSDQPCTNDKCIAAGLNSVQLSGVLSMSNTQLAQLEAQQQLQAQQRPPAPAQNTQSDLKGPYVADLKSKQIAPLLDPNHQPSDKDIVGNGQCVSACSKFSGVTGDTKRWRAGAGVADNGDIKPGTAIATFDSNGRYPTGKDKNSAIYLGPGTKGSIWVLDQWPAHAPNPAHPPQPREVLNDNSRGISNNSNSYHVILVAPEE
jgi:RHS repeat-associated protein